MATIVYSYGSATVSVPSGSKLAVTSASPVQIYKQVGYPQFPSQRTLFATTTAGERYVSAAVSAATTFVLQPGAADAQYEVGVELTFNGAPVPLRFVAQGTPTTATDTATLTVAQLLSGMIVATPTSAATYTTPTGAEIEAAIPTSMGLNDCFDLVVINLGGAGDDITYTPGATGISLVGDAVVRSIADSGTEQAGQGIFRHRRSAASTYIAYRIA